jgi:hypothetical protein
MDLYGWDAFCSVPHYDKILASRIVAGETYTRQCLIDGKRRYVTIAGVGHEFVPGKEDGLNEAGKYYLRRRVVDDPGEGRGV